LDASYPHKNNHILGLFGGIILWHPVGIDSMPYSLFKGVDFDTFTIASTSSIWFL